MAHIDINTIQAELLLQIDEKRKQLRSMPPLPEDAAQKLHEEALLLHTYHSDAIEGNTLTLTETHLIITEGATIEENSRKENREAANTAKAFELTETLAESGAPISHATIQRIHAVVTESISEDAGNYRRTNIRAIGSTKASPNWTEVTKRMNRLLLDVQHSRLHPVETAAFLHQQLVEIHPFKDENGQVARLLTNLYLLERGYPVVLIKREDRKIYNQYLKLAHSGDLTPFSHFITKAVDESLTRIFSAYEEEDELIQEDSPA